jgi:hypothetical protein
VLAWPDLLDTLGGFFAVECTLVSITAVPRATFTRLDLAALWRDATLDLVQLLLGRFRAFRQNLLAHPLPPLPRPGDPAAAAASSPHGGGSSSSSSSSSSSNRVSGPAETGTSASGSALNESCAVGLQADPLVGLLLLKESCLGLTRSLGPRTYLFPGRPLRRALRQVLLPQFVALELSALQLRCAHAVARDGHQPWAVGCDAEYAQWVEPLALDRLFLDAAAAVGPGLALPVAFSFSAAVPHVGLLLHKFLAQCLAFCHGLGPETSNSDDDDDGDDDEIENENEAGASSGVSGIESRGALLRGALADAVASVGSTLNALLASDAGGSSDPNRASGNPAASPHEAGSSVFGRTLLGLAGGAKKGRGALREPGQAVSISLAAQVSLDARAYAALAPKLGALLEHALSAAGWPDAQSPHLNGGQGGSRGQRSSSLSPSPAFSGLDTSDLGAANDWPLGRDGDGAWPATSAAARSVASAAIGLEATADRAQDLIFELARAAHNCILKSSV